MWQHFAKFIKFMCEFLKKILQQSECAVSGSSSVKVTVFIIVINWDRFQDIFRSQVSPNCRTQAATQLCACKTEAG